VIIFLDIDGVLNSTEWSECRPLRGFIPPGTAQQAFDEERIDPHCVEHLRRIVERTGAKLVLASTWRHRMSVAELVRLFALYGWSDGPVIDGTPRYDWPHQGQGLRGGGPAGEPLNTPGRMFALTTTTISGPASRWFRPIPRWV
jgi:hypothetical protein